MINVSFTDQEVGALLQLLDLAVKAGGLNAAGAAFLLQQKLAAAARGPEPQSYNSPAADTVTDKVD